MASHIDQGLRWDPRGRLFCVSDSIGATVVDRHGGNLGMLEDLVLDDDGRIEYGVISPDGFLGSGPKLIAVPWPALHLDAVRHRFVLDASREALERAPTFARDNWPDMADPGWRRQVHSYYGVEPAQMRTGADIESGTNSSDSEPRATAPPHQIAEREAA